MNSPTSRGALAVAISNLMVRLLTDYAGRGATQARTYVYDDVVTVVLRDTLTKGERTLAQSGHAEHVLSMRKMFQRTMAGDAIAGVQELTGRRVVAFLSDNHLDPDISVETFILDADAHGGDAVPGDAAAGR